MALAAGFDEGLLVDESGRISEGTIINVGFWRDGVVIWPDRKLLASPPSSCGASSQRPMSGKRRSQSTCRIRWLRRDDLVQLARLGAGGTVDDLAIAQDEAFANVIEQPSTPAHGMRSSSL